jgi:hypothetical protein
MPNPESDLPGDNRICSGCVGERYLKQLIRTDGTQELCSYCNDENLTLSIQEVADLVEHAFDDHYQQTPTEPDGFEYAMSRDPELDYSWERDGESAMWAILNAADVSEEVAEDIRSLLEDRHYDHESATMGEECPFSVDSQYAEKDAGHGEFPMLWRDFESELKTRARFFSSSAQSILDQIFAGVSDLQTSEGAPVVAPAGPETSIPTLYRARVFAGEDDRLKEALKAPWKHLGTPPADAASAGRMNARGIAVFYGARDADTALSEVRPPVGSKVALARFDILRPLRLLDLSALESVAAGGSIFDPGTIGRMQWGNFLQKLSHMMARAVMPHEEASEYLPTQAIADYLANEIQLDGIIFPSVQTGQESSNVVLFHHAARVEEVILPEGTEVDAYLETTDSDDTHPDYRVWEKLPAPSPGDEPRAHPFHWGHFGLRRFDEPLDTRVPALRIDHKSIQIHHVTAVAFTAVAHPVHRHRLSSTD